MYLGKLGPKIWCVLGGPNSDEPGNLVVRKATGWVVLITSGRRAVLKTQLLPRAKQRK